MLHPPTAFLVVALLYVALPLTAWTILYRRHDRRSVSLWCVGSLCLGCAFLLMGVRGEIPVWLFVLSTPLAHLAHPLRFLALRRELGRANGGGPVVACWAAWAGASLAYVAVYALSSLEAPSLLVLLMGHLAGSAAVVWLAWALYRQHGFRSAALLAATYGLFCLALLIRAGSVVVSWETAYTMSPTTDFVLTYVSGIVAALYGNLGYIGIAMETAQARELGRSVDLAREHERRMQTEDRVREQRALLAQRGRLLAEREEMLATLAHEVRQPLNNASAALQSAADALGSGDGHGPAASRVQRAGAVLGLVTAVLDNTLADAVLLSGSQPVERQDVDIDTLAQLAIADIDPSHRPRVRYERVTDSRTAAAHLGLVRLALRNVIANALAYAPPASPVVVRIADHEEPLALVVEVQDEGGGFPADMLPRVFERGARGASASQGHGLGLYIVRRVMELHSGHVQVAHNAPGCVVVRMVIPQGVAPGRAQSGTDAHAGVGTVMPWPRSSSAA